jgi:hypothetical protein
MTKNFLTFLFVYLGLNTCCLAAHLHPEKDYQSYICKDMGGTMEHILPDKTRVDCLTDKYVIEVGFIDHKFEDVGQSLYYAIITGKKPMIATIIENDFAAKHNLKILQTLCEKYGIKLIILRPDVFHKTKTPPAQ